MPWLWSCDVMMNLTEDELLPLQTIRQVSPATAFTRGVIPF